LVNKRKTEYETEDKETLNQLLNPQAAVESAQKIVESNKVQEYSTGLLSLTSDQI
jgi:hypothetical protein